MGWAASIPYLAAAIGLLAIGFLDRRLRGARRTLLVSCCALLAARGLLLAFKADTAIQSVAGLSFAAMFLFGQLGPSAALMIGLPPEASRGAYAGLISTGTQGAGIVVPIVIGFVVRESGSFTSGSAFMIGSLLVSAACDAALQFHGTAAFPASGASRQRLA